MEGFELKTLWNHWPSLDISWPTEETIDLILVNIVWEVCMEPSGHQDKFPYIDSSCVLAQDSSGWICYQNLHCLRDTGYKDY